MAAGENETIKKDPNDDPIERLLYKEVTEATEQTWQEISKFVTKKQRDSLKTENNYLIKDTIRFATLQPMDFFGGRALLEGDVIQDSETQNPISLKRMTSDPSKFSIVIII